MQTRYVELSVDMCIIRVQKCNLALWKGIEMAKRIRGVTVKCDDGTAFVWTAPTRFYRYHEGEMIDSSRRKDGMSIAEANAYCDAHEVSQHLHVQR